MDSNQAIFDRSSALAAIIRKVNKMDEPQLAVPDPGIGTGRWPVAPGMR